MTHAQTLYLLLVVAGFVIFVGALMWATISTAFSGSRSDTAEHHQAHAGHDH
jgi:hypothetical protein